MKGSVERKHFMAASPSSNNSINHNNNSTIPFKHVKRRRRKKSSNSPTHSTSSSPTRSSTSPKNRRHQEHEEHTTLVVAFISSGDELGDNPEEELESYQQQHEEEEEEGYPEVPDSTLDSITPPKQLTEEEYEYGEFEEQPQEEFDDQEELELQEQQYFANNENSYLDELPEEDDENLLHDDALPPALLEEDDESLFASSHEPSFSKGSPAQNQTKQPNQQRNASSSSLLVKPENKFQFDLIEDEHSITQHEETQPQMKSANSFFNKTPSHNRFPSYAVATADVQQQQHFVESIASSSANQEESNNINTDNILESEFASSKNNADTSINNGVNSTSKVSNAALGLKQSEKLIDELQKENFGLKLKIYFLEESLEKIAPDGFFAVLQENIQLKTELEQIKQNYETQRNHLTEIAGDSAVTHEQYDALQENVAHLEEENESYWNMIQELETQLQEVTESNHNQQEDLIRVVKENESIRESQENVDAKVAQLTSQIQSMEKQLTKLHEEKESIQKLSSLELSKLKENKAKIESQEVKVKYLEARLAESKEHCLKLGEIVYSLEGQMKEEKSVHAEVILELESQIEKLEQQNRKVEQKSSQIKKYQEDSQSWKFKHDSIKEMYSEEQTRAKQLLQKTEKQEEDIHNLRIVLANANNEKLKTDATINEGFVRTEVLSKNLQSSLHQVEQLQTEKQSLELKVSQLSHSLKQKDELLDTERKRSDLLEASKENLTNQQLNEKEEYRKLLAQVEETQSEYNVLLERSEKAHVEKNQLELKLNHLNRLVEEKDELINTERQRSDLLEASKESLAHEQSNMNEEIRKLLSQIEEMQSDYNVLLGKLDDLKQQHDLNKQQEEQYRDSVKEVKEENPDTLLKRQDDLVKEKEESKSFLNSALQSINDLKQVISNQTASFQKMEEEARLTYEQNLKELLRKIEGLEKEASVLRGENSALLQQKVDIETFLQNNSERQLIVEISKLNNLLSQKTEEANTLQRALSDLQQQRQHGNLNYQSSGAHLEQVQQLQTRISRLEEEVQYLRNASEQYEFALNKANSSAKEHERIIERLTKQNRNLVEKLNEAEANQIKISEVANQQKDYEQLEFKMKEQEKANKILQRAVIERSNFLSHILVHLHERLHPDQPMNGTPDFNREYSNYANKIKNYLEKLQEMHNTFRQEAKDIQDRLAQEKKLFDRKLLTLSKKLVSFESIIREAAKNQVRIREQRNQYKEEVERLQKEKSELEAKLAQETEQDIANRAETQSDIQTSFNKVIELKKQLHDVEEQLYLERKGAEDRVAELLKMTRELEEKREYWKKKYESVDKQQEYQLRRSLSQEKYHELRQLNQKLRAELQEKIRQIEKTEEDYAKVRRYCKTLKRQASQRKLANNVPSEQEDYGVSRPTTTNTVNTQHRYTTYRHHQDADHYSQPQQQNHRHEKSGTSQYQARSKSNGKLNEIGDVGGLRSSIQNRYLDSEYASIDEMLSGELI